LTKKFQSEDILGIIAPFGETSTAPQARFRSDADIQVQFLGVFRVWFRGKPVSIPTAGKVRSLLAWLLRYGHSKRHRDTVGAALWGEQIDETSMRNNLNVNLSRLRTHLLAEINLAQDLICHADGCYYLHPNWSIESDLDVYDTMLRQAEHWLQKGEKSKAAILYNDLSAISHLEFAEDLRREEWTDMERTQWRDLMLDTTEWLADYYLHENQYVAAIKQLQRLLQFDACQEDIHLKIANCYARQGKLEKALRQKTLCEKSMREQVKHYRVSPAWERVLEG
jgi:DNA-binding SARP family transcriptional activator